MPLCSVEEAVADIRAGKMVILVDDEDRENEGDLTMAAEHVTPEAINFMAKFGRGLICLPMAPELCDKLGLPLMTRRNLSRFGTNFTISIEAREGIATGISAADRARTIQVAVADNARPEDLVSPGHVFPLRAKADGVLARTGQTEGGVDLARLAGLKPAWPRHHVFRLAGCGRHEISRNGRIQYGADNFRHARPAEFGGGFRHRFGHDFRYSIGYSHRIQYEGK